MCRVLVGKVHVLGQVRGNIESSLLIRSHLAWQGHMPGVFAQTHGSHGPGRSDRFSATQFQTPISSFFCLCFIRAPIPLVHPSASPLLCASHFRVPCWGAPRVPARSLPSAPFRQPPPLRLPLCAPPPLGHAPFFRPRFACTGGAGRYAPSPLLP